MQQTLQKGPYRIFLSSTAEDDVWCQRLVQHLQPLVYRNRLEVWHRNLILPGASTPEARARALQRADLFVALLSPDYLGSEVYEEDLLRALERRQDDRIQIAPILLRSCIWQTTELATLQMLPRNKQPMAQWANQDEVLTQVAQEILACGTLSAEAPSLSSREQINRERFLAQMHDTWIKGLLNPSLQKTTHLELHLQTQPDALDDPWQSAYQERHREPQPFPPGISMLQIYEEAKGELLLLGESGAGKTTLLLELARDLLKQAERHDDLPMPVIFNLSSWTPQHPSFAAWMIDELRSMKYHIPRKVAADWIEQNQLIPLLDGLPEPLREGCVQAINAYQQERRIHDAAPLVVTCRHQQYEDLTTHLSLTCAVRVLPLTDEQIEEYLAQSGGHLDALHTMLRQDQELLALARQPLMLGIFTLTYRDSNIADLPTQESSQQLQRTIFADYVRCMLTRRGTLPSWMQAAEVQSWLCTIAVHLQEQQEAAFSIENLQPNWLPEKYRRFYKWSTILFFGLLIGLNFGLIFGLLFGFILGVAVGLIVGSAVGLAFGLLVWLGVNFGEAIGVKVGIVPAEVLTLSWETVQKELAAWSIFGLIAAPVVGIISWLIIRSTLGLAIGLGFGLGGGLIGFLTLLPVTIGLFSKQLDQRAHLKPNEGIWRSAKNGLYLGLPVGLLIWLFIGLLSTPFSGLLFGLLFGLACILFSGLSAFLQHFILRFWLWRSRALPWNLIAFLDEAATRLLLNKAGGSYLFVHRLLLEYLASLKSPPLSDAGTQPLNEDTLTNNDE